MSTYLLLSLAVLVPVLLLAAGLLALRARIGRRRVLVACAATLGVLVVLTAVFDSVIVGTGIVGYHADRILGVRVGTAPIEDFAYPVAAAVALPALWLGLPGRRRS